MIKMCFDTIGQTLHPRELCIIIIIIRADRRSTPMGSEIRVLFLVYYIVCCRHVWWIVLQIFFSLYEKYTAVQILLTPQPKSLVELVLFRLLPVNWWAEGFNLVQFTRFLQYMFLEQLSKMREFSLGQNFARHAWQDNIRTNCYPETVIFLRMGLWSLGVHIIRFFDRHRFHRAFECQIIVVN